MSKRQVWVWVVEIKLRGSWVTQIPECSLSLARKYNRSFREANPGLETRIVKYVPEKP